MLFYVITNKDVMPPPLDQNEFDKFLNDRSH